MTLWRGSTTPEVQADIDRLFEAASRAAADLLRIHGQFIPASLVLTETGEQAFVMVENDVDTAREMAEILYEGHRQQADLLRCVSVYKDFQVGGPQPSDVILVHLEHRDGPSVAVSIPYKRTKHPGGHDLELGELHAWEVDAVSGNSHFATG